MDEKDGAIRDYLASKADFLGAMRLPNTSFKDNAGTIVTTDIIFLQKRPAGQERGGEEWQYLAEYKSPEDGEIFLDKRIFCRSPEHDARHNEVRASPIWDAAGTCRRN